MNPNLASTYVAQSPKRTGLLIFGVTTLVVGLAFVVKYLVEKDRKDAGYPDIGEDTLSVYQPNATSIGSLLDELTAFGQSQQSPSVAQIPENIGCNQKWNKLQEVDKFNPSNNINKCGLGVYEFKDMLIEMGYLTEADGRYGTKTLLAHKQWLTTSD